jgi:hypothetical protein
MLKTNTGVPRLINPKGRELYQTIQEKQLEILSMGEPTFWPTYINKTLDLLDFFIFKGLPHNSLDIGPNLVIASDHTHLEPPKLHNSQTGKHSELKSKKIYDSTSRSKQRKTSRRLLQNSPT